MKRLYNSLQVALILCSLSTYPSQGLAQCDVWFNTYSNLCDLSTVILEAEPLSGAAPYTFLWETGETTQTILIPNALGDYMLTMTDANGCTAIINCHVKMWPNPVFYPFTDYACEGDTVQLSIDWIRDEIPGLIYEWSNGETGQTILATEDMTWTVTVTDPATGCEWISEPQELTFDPLPDPQIIGQTEICNGQAIVLTLENGPFDYITWYPNYEWEESITVTEPGTYWVEVFNADNFWCYGVDTIVIAPGEIPEPLISGPPDLCYGQTGTVTITNHNEFEAFEWSNGETDYSFVAENPGTYFVTVTDAGGCTAIESFTIEDAIENELEADPIAATCGQSNGGIQISYSISGSYEFEWSNGSTEQNLEDVPSGTYSVTVTDVDGCSSEIEAIIPEEFVPILINENITPNSSCSEFNGSINLFITPEEPYEIVWSTGETSEDLIEIASGNYTVTVSLGVTCQEIQTYFVDDISAAPDLQSVVTPASCGETNGEIDLQLIGGTAPFTYAWSNGNNGEDLSNLAAGSYTVTVTAADGCSSTAEIEVTDSGLPIDISALIQPNTSCTSANGSIDVSISPADNYSFVWSNGATSEDLTAIGAGEYIVTATLGGCSETDTFTVTNASLPFTITGNTLPNTSCNAGNGTIDISITPAGSYTFQWSGGSANEDLQNLSGGSYTVTVTNTDGCAINSTFIIDNLASSFNVSALTIANTSCQVPNGMIDISISPTAQYSYLWSTGSTLEDLQNVGAGSYTVTVTNPEGCSVDTSFAVTDQSAPFSISATTSPDTSCQNPTGVLDLTITPSGIYSFVWSSGATSEDLQSLGSGIYSVTVSEVASSCTSTAVFTIESNTADPVITASLLDEVCGEGNGAIDISIAPLGSTVVWSTGVSTEDITDLSAGNYHVIVTAPNGCIAKDTFNIANTSNSFSIAAITNDNSSCVSANGSLDLNITPVGSYTFLWSTGDTSEDLSNLDEGTYTVTITDHLNCSSTESFTIQSNTPDPVISPVIVPATCGNDNGQITLTITPSSGNIFSWSNGSAFEALQNISAGNYSVTVTSANGCSATADFDVPDNNSDAQLSGIVSNNKSCINSNGSVDLTVAPAGAYTYSWSNGATSADLQAVSSGTFSVTVTDVYGCEFISSFVITDNTVDPVITSNVTPASCGQPNGSIDIQVSVTANNSFLWSNNQTTQDLNLVNPGSYTVTVTSDQGCTATAVIIVPNQNSNFSISSLVVHNESCSTPEGGVDLTVTPAGAYTFVWSDGNTAEDLTGISSGIYTVTVTDQFSCSSAEEFIIEDLTIPPIISFNITPSTCGNQNGKIDLAVIPESPANQFVWSSGHDIEDPVDLAEGIYSVTVTDVNGCTAQGELSVPGTAPLELNIDADLLSVPVGGNVLCSLQLNVPLSAIDSIFWLPQNMLSCTDPLCLEQNLTLNEQTEVSVMVTDTNGCFGQAFLMLTILKEFRVYIPNVFTPNRGGENDKFTIYTNEDVEEVVVLEIFDRWGNCVFINETFPPNEPNYGWDGSFSEKEMNPDVFAYRAVVRFSNGEEHRYKGDVTLVR